MLGWGGETDDAAIWNIWAELTWLYTLHSVCWCCCHGNRVYKCSGLNLRQPYRKEETFLAADIWNCLIIVSAGLLGQRHLCPVLWVTFFTVFLISFFFCSNFRSSADQRGRDPVCGQCRSGWRWVEPGASYTSTSCSPYHSKWQACHCCCCHGDQSG